MSDREHGRLAAEGVIESGREVAGATPVGGITLREDDLEQVVATASNTIRLGQETN